MEETAIVMPSPLYLFCMCTLFPLPCRYVLRLCLSPVLVSSLKFCTLTARRKEKCIVLIAIHFVDFGIVVVVIIVFFIHVHSAHTSLWFVIHPNERRSRLIVSAQMRGSWLSVAVFYLFAFIFAPRT